MPGYSVDGNQNAAADITIIGVTRGADKRIFADYLAIGSAATPADQANNLQINRTPAAGTSTAVTPRPFDPSDGASVATAGENHSAEPTKTSGLVLLSISPNSRSLAQCYAKAGRPLIVPDTAANGLALVFIVATGTQLFEATIHFDE